MDIAPNVLRIAVADCFMRVRERAIHRRFVTAYGRFRSRMLRYEAMDGGLVGMLRDLGTHLVRSTVLRAGDRGLPNGPRPVRCSCFDFGIFARRPSMYVSSTSTGPTKMLPPPSNAARSRCAKRQADFCVMLRSRCSFMLDTLLRLVKHRWMAIAHT